MPVPQLLNATSSSNRAACQHLHQHKQHLLLLWPIRTRTQLSRCSVVAASAATPRPPRWMKVVEAHEYSFYFGYSNDSPATSAATAAASATTAYGGSNSGSSSATLQHDQQQSPAVDRQQVQQAIANAADWADLLQLAQQYSEGQYTEQLPADLWMRLLFRLFVSLYECNWDGVDADDLLQEQIPPLLLAAADSLVDGAGVASAAEAAAPASEGASEGQAAATFTEPMLQQLEQQGRFVGQLADMLYALAVLACDTAERSARAHAAADAGVDGLPVDSSSSTDGSSGSSTGGDAQQHWYQSDGMHQLLEAVAARSTSWDMGCVSRKDAVSLLWAFGKLLQLQQHHSSPPAAASSGSSAGSSSSSSSKQQFVSQLCSHITHLIQLSNNTADSSTATASTATTSRPQNPSHSSHEVTEPFHPEDLTDTVTGLAAAAGFGDSSVAHAGRLGFSNSFTKPQRGRDSGGFKSQAAAGLLDAVGHEVYRQLSNRHSSAGDFTVEGVVALLQAYCDLDYRDGPSLRMFDAVAGWVVKRVRARHMRAPSSPPQLAAVGGVFARLQHRSVVVPELLNALSTQACKAAAAAVELAASDPHSYHSSDSSSYCHWLPQHAATLLQSYVQLGYRPPGVVVDSVLTALMLHWEHEQQPGFGDSEQLLGFWEHEDSALGQAQENAGGMQAGLAAVVPAQKNDEQEGLGQAQSVLQQEQHCQQQQECDDTTTTSSSSSSSCPQVVPSQQQVEQQVSAVQLLDVLAQLGAHYGPGQRVLNTLLQQAWSNSPQLHLSHQQLLTLLFSSAQLATAASGAAAAAVAAMLPPALPAAAAVPPDSVIAAVADELILTTMPEYQQHQQQHNRHNCHQHQAVRLSASDIIRVLWSLCVFDSCLDIARYGWLLVALAGTPDWQRLEEQQLMVIKQGQVMLGQDGEDMVTEMLPAQLVSRVEAAKI